MMLSNEVGVIPIISEANGGVTIIGQESRDFLEIKVFLLFWVEIRIFYFLKCDFHTRVKPTRDGN